MIKKALIMLVLLTLIGQVIYFIWTPDSFQLLVLKTLVIVFAVKVFGDLLGRFVFQFPNYDWIYLRDYLKNSLGSTSAVFFAFAVLWYVPIGLDFYWSNQPSIFMHAWGGGLLPAIFYCTINYYEIVRESSDEKRLRRKL